MGMCILSFERGEKTVSENAIFTFLSSSPHFLLNFRKMDQKLKIRERLLFSFKMGKSAAEACRNVNESFGRDVVSEPTCRRWFTKFREEGENINDKQRSGRPSGLDPEVLRDRMNDQPATSVRKLSAELYSSKSTVHRHLKGLELSKRSGRSVPHDLTQVQKQTRVELAQQLLERLQQQPFLHRIITCDESWVLYDNRAVESQWLAKGQVAQASPKTLWPKKQLLCVWWGVGGVVHWELLPIGGTVNAKVYCQQLQRVHDRLRRPPYTTLSRMGIILQHDGAAPHRANLTQQKIEELGWEVLPHPAHSPDLAPSDYYLFRPLKMFLRGKQFVEADDLENDIRHFFDSKPADWYQRGIEKLPQLWEEVIGANGEYFVEP